MRVTCRGGGLFPRLGAWAIQLRRNIVEVASRWRRCVRFYLPVNRTPGFPHRKRCLQPPHRRAGSNQDANEIYFCLGQLIYDGNLFTWGRFLAKSLSVYRFLGLGIDTQKSEKIIDIRQFTKSKEIFDFDGSLKK